MSRKSDLKPGMRVVLNNGREYFVVDEKHLVHADGGFNVLSDYDENLSCYYHPEDWGVDVIYDYDTNTKKWKEISKKPQKIEKKFNIYQDFEVLATFSGNKTTVLLPDGIQASTTCLPEDKYDEDRGLQIALHKAMIKSLEKELKGLSK